MESRSIVSQCSCLHIWTNIRPKYFIHTFALDELFAKMSNVLFNRFIVYSQCSREKRGLWADSACVKVGENWSVLLSQ
ncbi:uncharacterized protein PHALS_09785 [Plasmopara halstedii]|uniref:Uncharacterized protein n=1 Tax=Plasmopara halstedii TaxID=4781 RepID=A0A0P1AFD8_PLAHL|nr:uncharacterized protein PHALS_09785 [Plasmopara halstedii]CEG39543.1 hypothetical protein PHALS_09785 [Plasmopara halstedii]|eukprot:XP_024575912.1 hypothetical protein PHALS_09785 [Plasmopara halstedii]